MSLNIGLDSQKDILLDLAKSGGLSHAIIIESDDIQKAEEFFGNIIKIMFCTGDSKPCGKCGNCIKLESKSHPDVVTIEATGKNKSIKIDDVRKIREDAYIVSNEGSGKFYIIKNAEFMTVQAQNALIKILEEPPKNVTFVLICEFSENLLSTIRSRSHIFKIKSDSENEESNISALAKKIAGESLSGRNDKILEYISECSSDRKEFKVLIENIIESFIDYLKSESIDKKTAGSLARKMGKLRDLATLVDKNVNINLLVCAVCSCL